MKPEAKEPLSIVAVVSMNDGEALVLNRELELVYEKMPNGDYVGEDGPFKNLLFFRHGSGSSKAFAGRELVLKMKDGTLNKIKNHWWHGLLKDTQSVFACDIDSLKKCYVFSGGFSVNKEEFDALRSTYTGPVYPYWDYEKIIKFDDMRNDLYKRLWHEEKRVKELIKQVKTRYCQVAELKRQCDALVADNVGLKGIVDSVTDLDNEPQYHESGMGCGLEDRNITDRYEAMRHGWDSAMERVYGEVIPCAEELSFPATDSAARELMARGVDQAALGFHEKAFVAFDGSNEPGLYVRAQLQLLAQQLRNGEA
ncbi:hypothetical protein AB6D34_09245 [Pectobacterium brasiliense]|uniref:Uncharacterized protein n=1 Tax=Pectobacterium brasiliense TaxID=180957 RepID=A0A433NJB2_9GAMM|nr:MULTISPECIES: hypothetical protein [Pectobacterium]GKW27802.1 hypothetical protein PEC331060_09800 [Pectobacterium carotovorum subsp. carotovorum]MBN3046543.1 hypothetical protein [Pectobacterium brasiliense]MBN3056796.1 hypothetical protein [Pectobacterium brasiliense]MBN3075324.1 hypothetical protein [Pectobacterium brasiliense]MBN3083550.1 hypothetical protein [Pectobacterium brasiliense]